MSNGWSAGQKVSNLVGFNSGLNLTRQAGLLDISRQSLYYQPASVGQEEIDIKNQIDTIYTKCPFYGYRKITHELVKLRKELINHKRVSKYMREMGLQAVYKKPNTSKPNFEHQIFVTWD